MMKGWNELQEVDDLADEVETVRSLEAAARDAGGSLDVEPSGAHILRGLGATHMVVHTAGDSAFPLAMRMHTGWVILPACGNPAEFSSWLATNGHSQPALPDQAPVGWDLLSAGDGFQLVRIDASLAGWPTTALIHLDGDEAVVQVEQPVSVASGFAGAEAIAHLLAAAADRPPVNMWFAAGPNETDGHAQPGGIVIYEIRLPAVLLTPQRLGAALAAISGRYTELASACAALAAEPTLVRAYQLIHSNGTAGSQSVH
jgi:hypothetical protein